MTVVARHFPSMAGTLYRVGQIVLAFKNMESEHAFSLVESVEPPRVGAALHRHGTYEETFFVCAGRYRFVVGDEERTLDVGDTVFIPRRVPHGFTCLGPDPGRLLTISTPGGVFEAFIRELCHTIEQNPDARAASVRRVAERHGIEFL